MSNINISNKSKIAPGPKIYDRAARFLSRNPPLPSNLMQRAESRQTLVPAPAIDEMQEQVDPRLNSLIWSWIPQEKQSLALASKAKEIYFGGARFGGKTYCQIMWLGRMAIERLNGLIRYGNYNGLVLRRQYEDLKGWIREAEAIYCSKFGAEKVGTPAVFRFPGGPVVNTGHLDNPEGYQKYQGQQWHKLGYDELNQIEKEDTYLPVLGSNRMSPDGLSQCFNTGNPGGPGDRWIKNRFIYVYSGGKLIPWGTVFMDPVSKSTRVFIQSLPSDNPIGLAADHTYLNQLAGQGEIRKRQWLAGDWDAVESAFFAEFRPNHIEFEPREAYHGIDSKSVELLPYYRRWISVDWGYNDLCVVYWWCQHDDGRIYTYREMACRKIGAFEVGAQIAKLTYDELAKLPDQTIEIALSPDAFWKKDNRNTIAERMVQGMESILGLNTAMSISMTDEELKMAEHNPTEAQKIFIQRTIESISSAGVIIRPANNNRAIGLEYMNEMLRWSSVVETPDIQRLLKELKGVDLATQVKLINKYELRRKSESVMPKWRIFRDKCPLLMATLPICQQNPTKPEDHIEFSGDDPIDAARYGIMAYMEMPAEMPKSYQIQRLIDNFKRDNPSTDLHALHMMWLRAKSRIERNEVINKSHEVARAMGLEDNDLGFAQTSDTLEVDGKLVGVSVLDPFGHHGENYDQYNGFDF